jgi:hypothetical protein
MRSPDAQLGQAAHVMGSDVAWHGLLVHIVDFYLRRVRGGLLRQKQGVRILQESW